jgi:cytochrome P450 family 135
VRRCSGAAFAQLEMKEVLAAIVRRTRLRPDRPRRERAVFKHVTVVPLRGCRVVLEERLAGTQPAPAERRAPVLSAG